MRLFSSIITVFMTPARPLPPSKCPILDLIEPTLRGRSNGRPGAKTFDSEAASIGSPVDVPVPWASCKTIEHGHQWAVPGLLGWRGRTYHITRLGWIKPGCLVCTLNEFYLGLSTGKRNANCSSILVYPGVSDNPSNTIAILKGCFERFENNTGYSFATAKSIRPFVIHVAPAIRGKHPREISMATTPVKAQEDETDTSAYSRPAWVHG